ncbi:MAG: ATP-dependent DNA helicase UvrD2 [Actinomycetia bacterium]|nr:ATP-dependent DNA helicase UvrD2 [Actinomycetes bacterium]
MERRVDLARTATELAGPDPLGRSLLVRPNQPIPDQWEVAPVVDASAEADPDLIERLHRAWRQRERLVIVWSGPLPETAPRLDVAFHTLSPTTELEGERLRFAVTANAVDLLEPSPSFAPLQRALALGAELAPTGGESGGIVADTAQAEVILVDGTSAWVDGGPLDHLPTDALSGHPVIPRIHLTAGRLEVERAMRDQPTAELAPDQLSAVGHRGGPARIIAPAGSGKTRVLTERTRHLINDRAISPSAVSLVAYNRRARAEMADRLDDINGLDIRTLNSLALAIATGRGPFLAADRRARLATINEIEARRLLQDIVPGRRRRQLTDPLEPWIDALSACRLGLRDPDEIEASYGGDVAGFPEVLETYRSTLARRGQLDFDEQILTSITVLLTEPEARAAARRATPLLLVDEFQDLTPAHLLLVRLLAGPPAEVFAVGDDDQTIYGYSGASPDWLVNFARFFPGAADHRLTVNYRCPTPVVSAAANLLSYNHNRVVKEITPNPANQSEHTPANGAETAGAIPGFAARASADPQQALVTRVEQLLEGGAKPSEIAVLARVNAALLPAAVFLAEEGHPVAKPAGVGTHLLERSGFAAALAWLRLASAPEQRLGSEDLRLALRRPPRSVHPRIVDWICEQSSVKGLLALSNRLTSERDATHLSELAADITSLRERYDEGASASELLDTIYNEIGLLGAASQLDQSQRTARRAAHADELAALRAMADIGPGPIELEPWIRDHLEAMPTQEHDDGAEAITLATVHTTKGLEWDHVIVHDVRGDLHPHRLATDIEEERRIFHVAITRGRHSVLVNAVGPGSSHPSSPFLDELAQPRPADRPWPTVEPVAATVVTSGGRKAKGGGTKRERPEPGSEGEAARRQALTSWRTQRCKSDSVPAYVVLDNATLDAIAATAPASLAALGRIKGIGPTKLDRYGADILGIIESTG